MSQSVVNNATSINAQFNIENNNGPIYNTNRTRFSRRFEKLNNEVAKDERYDGVMESLKYYLTKKDGIDMPTKLHDGGFTEIEITRASIRKDKFAKRIEKNLFFESAQWIDCQLFAVIISKFEVYVEVPLINMGANKEEIITAVLEKVVTPVLEIINEEGEYDDFLNYTIDDVFGMVYYLTGRCHINWKNYDSI